MVSNVKVFCAMGLFLTALYAFSHLPVAVDAVIADEVEEEKKRGRG